MYMSLFNYLNFLVFPIWEAPVQFTPSPLHNLFIVSSWALGDHPDHTSPNANVTSY